MKATSKRLLVFTLMFSMLLSLLSPMQLVSASTAKAAAPMTRGEVCKLVNSLIGATQESANMKSIINYKKTDAYYSVMSIAYNAGYIVPNKSHQLTNASAKANYNFVAIILSRVLKTTRLEVLGNHDPYAQLTSKELKSYLSEVFPTVITKNVSNKTYTGNVLINTPDITLTDTTIKGNLVIGDGVADKEAILNNVKVTGKLIVRGGGENSIKIMGSSSISTIEIDQVNNAVSIKVSGASEVQIININDGCDDVILYGSIGTVNIVGNDLKVSTNGATIANVNLAGSNPSFSVSADTTVQAVEVKENASDAKLNIAGAVTSVVAAAANASIQVDGKGSISTVTAGEAAKGIAINVSADASIKSISSAAAETVVSGTGKVETAKIDGSNSSITTPDTKVTVGTSASGVTTENTTNPNTNTNPGTNPGTNPTTAPEPTPTTAPTPTPTTTPTPTPTTTPTPTPTTPEPTPATNPPVIWQTYWADKSTSSETVGYSKRTVRVYVSTAIDTVSTVSGSAFTATGVNGSSITSVIAGHSNTITVYENWMDLTVEYPDGSDLNNLAIEYSPTDSSAVTNVTDHSKMASFKIFGSFAAATEPTNIFRIMKDSTPIIENVTVSSDGTKMNIRVTPYIYYDYYLTRFKFTINDTSDWTYNNIRLASDHRDFFIENPNETTAKSIYKIRIENTAGDKKIYDAGGNAYDYIEMTLDGSKVVKDPDFDWSKYN